VRARYVVLVRHPRPTRAGRLAIEPGAIGQLEARLIEQDLDRGREEFGEASALLGALVPCGLRRLVILGRRFARWRWTAGSRSVTKRTETMPSRFMPRISRPATRGIGRHCQHLRLRVRSSDDRTRLPLPSRIERDAAGGRKLARHRWPRARDPSQVVDHQPAGVEQNLVELIPTRNEVAPVW
jgi:hypothetical protein